ncbi:MAG: hypothetical protein NY202_04615 [Mollicutes bacterium UO1]
MKTKEKKSQKTTNLDKIKGIRRSRKIYGLQKLAKSHTFSNLEILIQQAQKAKQKTQVQKLKQAYRFKLTSWNQA